MKIQTTELALERVHQDGSKYTLKPATINGCSLPGIVYDKEEQTVWSKGGRKLDVRLHTFRDGNFVVDIDGRWIFGSSAKGTEKARYQEARARSLIREVNQ